MPRQPLAHSMRSTSSDSPNAFENRLLAALIYGGFFHSCSLDNLWTIQNKINQVRKTGEFVLGFPTSPAHTKQTDTKQNNPIQKCIEALNNDEVECPNIINQNGTNILNDLVVSEDHISEERPLIIIQNPNVYLAGYNVPKKTYYFISFELASAEYAVQEESNKETLFKNHLAPIVIDRATNQPILSQAVQIRYVARPSTNASPVAILTLTSSLAPAIKGLTSTPTFQDVIHLDYDQWPLDKLDANDPLYQFRNWAEQNTLKPRRGFTPSQIWEFLNDNERTKVYEKFEKEVLQSKNTFTSLENKR